MVNKLTILNRFVFHTLQRNITRLAVITRKTKKTRYFERGGTGKEPIITIYIEHINSTESNSSKNYPESHKNMGFKL